eukprot:378592_1
MALMFMHQEWFCWFELILTHCGSIILILLCIVHGINVISDLCTKQRKAVQFRQEMPSLSHSYIATASFAVLIITLFAFCVIIQSILIWNPFLFHCQYPAIILGELWLSAKQFMYLLFLLRLYKIYGDSQYSYNVNHLIIIAVLSVVWNAINCVNGSIFVDIEVTRYDNVSFAIHCQIHWPLWHLLSCGILDVTMSIIFLFAFIQPLISVIKLQISSDQMVEIQSNGLMNIGRKAFILTSITSLTTLFMLITVLFTASVSLSSIDCVVNCICIMLMSPYYSDKKYYQSLCCLPIKCINKCPIVTNIPPTNIQLS